MHDFDCVDRHNFNYHEIIPCSFIAHVIGFRTKSRKIAHLLIDSNIRCASEHRKFQLENVILNIRRRYEDSDDDMETRRRNGDNDTVVVGGTSTGNDS